MKKNQPSRTINIEKVERTNIQIPIWEIVNLKGKIMKDFNGDELIFRNKNCAKQMIYYYEKIFLEKLKVKLKNE